MEIISFSESKHLEQQLSKFASGPLAKLKLVTEDLKNIKEEVKELKQKLNAFYKEDVQELFQETLKSILEEKDKI